jgi:hypothetical protein
MSQSYIVKVKREVFYEVAVDAVSFAKAEEEAIKEIERDPCTYVIDSGNIETTEMKLDE